MVSKKSNKISVLIPDGESHLLVYVMNCLGSLKELDVFVMSSQKRNPMKFSKRIRKYKFYRDTGNDEIWIRNINSEILENSIDVVMPIFETGIRRILKNKQHLSSNADLILLPELSIFNKAINKWELAKHCFNEKISIPNSTIYFPNEVLPEDKLKSMKFPVIIKPLEGFGGGMGIQVFNAKNDLDVFLMRHCDTPVIIQEYIHGYDIDCSVLAENGKIIAFTIQKGYLEGEDPYKPQVGVQFIDEPKLFNLVQDLIQSLSWDGIAHIDCRYDQKADVYRIIEVNPRIWVTVDGSNIMGINFPLLWIYQTKKQPFEIKEYKKEPYLNLKGLVKSIKNNPMFILKLGFIFSNTQFRYVLLDPIPTAYKFFDRTRNIMLKKLN